MNMEHERPRKKNGLHGNPFFYIFYFLVLGDADLVLGDADLGDVLGLRRENGVYLHKCGGILHRGDRRVALHLQVRANSPLGVGFG
jgi:cellulose synthase/poly-beta-1,6-N-acetylglucosamine synthase-like glycosyltransferase